MHKEVKWVTHAGKHIPIKVENTKQSNAKVSGSSGATVSTGSGEKLSLGKKDEIKNFKGPKTRKK